MLEITGIFNKPFRKWKDLLRVKRNYETLLKENTDLLNKKFGGQAPPSSFSITSARIVSRHTGAYKNFIILDKGKADGIHVSDGVWTSEGAVGVVSSVSEHFSKVFLLRHPTVTLSVKLDKPGHYGFTNWKMNGEKLIRVVDIPVEADVQAGDTVRTSGMSLIFPENIPVGHVVEVVDTEGEGKVLKVRPFADIDRISYVYIGFNPRREELKKIINEP